MAFNMRRAPTTNDTRLYELLGVSKNAGETEIKKVRSPGRVLWNMTEEKKVEFVWEMMGVRTGFFDFFFVLS